MLINMVYRSCLANCQTTQDLKSQEMRKLSRISRIQCCTPLPTAHPTQIGNTSRNQTPRPTPTKFDAQTNSNTQNSIAPPSIPPHTRNTPPQPPNRQPPTQPPPPTPLWRARRRPVPQSASNKAAYLQLPYEYCKILRTPFFNSCLRWLLLKNS